jgi:DNA-binding NtrC family response regulator
VRRGAFDYLEKPFRDLDRVRATLRDAIAARACRVGLPHLPAETGAEAFAAGGGGEIPLSLEAYERCALERALREAGGDARAAARRLGIGRSTFYRKLARRQGRVDTEMAELPAEFRASESARGGVGRPSIIG